MARRFRAARGGGECANDPFLVDLSYLSTESVEGQPAERIISYIERGVADGRWAILCMHGIGDEHLSSKWTHLNECCSTCSAIGTASGPAPSSRWRTISSADAETWVTRASEMDQ